MIGTNGINRGARGGSRIRQRIERYKSTKSLGIRPLGLVGSKALLSLYIHHLMSPEMYPGDSSDT